MRIFLLKLCYVFCVFALAGCSTSTYQGVPDNAFPRHKLNFLFKESFSLDYSDLKSADWRILHQINTGAFAKTELVPNKGTDMDWKEKITIAYYPKATLPILEDPFSDNLTYIKNQLSKDCLLNNSRMGWSILSEGSDHIFVHLKWPGCSQEGISRINKTKDGVNELTFIRKGVLSKEDINNIKDTLTQARVIEYEK